MYDSIIAARKHFLKERYDKHHAVVQVEFNLLALLILRL